MNTWEVGDVRITSVAEIDDVSVPGEAVIPSASAEALQRHPWLVPHFAIHEDGDVYGDSVRPVIEAGLVDLVEFGRRVTDEVVLEPTPGHSPGHQSVHITSHGHEALIAGDVMHHPIQTCEPDYESSFDSDAVAARAMRREVLARYAGTDVLAIVTHFAGPGGGHVVADGDAWRIEV